ncbi:MAG: hypothetical protein GY679_01600 [Mycoplasma sp.]|nr:hypothetical protein [Mycoplasma sp.]
MTKEDIEQFKIDMETNRIRLDDYTKKHPERGRKVSLAFLIKLGTHNFDGSLTKEYGGKETRTSTKRQKKFVEKYLRLHDKIVRGDFDEWR